MEFEIAKDRRASENLHLQLQAVLAGICRNEGGKARKNAFHSLPPDGVKILWPLAIGRQNVI